MTTEQQGLRAGHLVALAGAIATLGSLWRPWYAIEVPQALRDALASDGARASGAGSLLGSFVQQVAAALPSRIEANGWDVLRGADVALCVVAIAVAALVLGVAGALGPSVRVDRAAASRWIASIALAGLAVAIEHVLVRPGDDAGIAVELGDGVWLAVAGTAAMAVGGALAGSGRRSAPAVPLSLLDLEGPGAASEDGRALTSVAPPGT
jgi:hypothetical protein